MAVQTPGFASWLIGKHEHERSSALCRTCAEMGLP